jgi:hypothetical protein
LTGFPNFCLRSRVFYFLRLHRRPLAPFPFQFVGGAPRTDFFSKQKSRQTRGAINNAQLGLSCLLLAEKIRSQFKRELRFSGSGRRRRRRKLKKNL